jgi:hypothetical protein
VVTGRDDLLGCALERRQARVDDQRAGYRAALVRHVAEHQPRPRPARRGEPPGQHPLRGRQQDDREGRDRVLRAPEHLRRVRRGQQRHQDQRRIVRHRAERADRRADVVAPVGHGEQGDA